MACGRISPKITISIVERKIAKYPGMIASKKIGKASYADALKITIVDIKAYLLRISGRMAFAYHINSFNFTYIMANFRMKNINRIYQLKKNIDIFLIQYCFFFLRFSSFQHNLKAKLIYR